MNFPTIPGQNARGKKGARVVSVPERMGRKTSPAACLAAVTISGSDRCIRWVFSMTTMASSTMIPRAKINPNITIMFMVNPIFGMIRKATNIDRGTERPTKKALLNPMKNIRIRVTRINPIIAVLLSSSRVLRVKRDCSPVSVDGKVRRK